MNVSGAHGVLWGSRFGCASGQPLELLGSPGKAENKKAAQDMLRALSQVNGMAAMGKSLLFFPRASSAPGQETHPILGKNT